MLLSLGHFMFGMPDITTSIPSPASGPSMNLSVVMGGTTSPYLDHRFVSVHIPPSNPFVEDFHSLRSVLTLVLRPGKGSENSPQME